MDELIVLCRSQGVRSVSRLVVVSNRVSVPDDGAKRAGGLEVALRPALQSHGGVWLGWSGKIAAGNLKEGGFQVEISLPMAVVTV